MFSDASRPEFSVAQVIFAGLKLQNKTTVKVLDCSSCEEQRPRHVMPLHLHFPLDKLDYNFQLLFLGSNQSILEGSTCSHSLAMFRIRFWSFDFSGEWRLVLEVALQMEEEGRGDRDHRGGGALCTGVTGWFLLYNSVLFSNVMDRTVLYCTVLYCTVLYCKVYSTMYTVLFWAVQELQVGSYHSNYC